MGRGVLLLIFACVFLVIDAQVPILGRCTNKYKPMKDFQKLKFMGKWYEAERFYTIRDIVATCVSVTYDRFDDGRIYVNNEYTNRLTRRRETLSGKFKLTTGENRGVFNVRYDFIPSYLSAFVPNFVPEFIQGFDSTLTILHTDYDNYAVLWSCRNLGQYGHTENAWLLTREQVPTEEVMQSAYGTLDKFGMRNLFIKSNQTNCDP